MVPGIVLAAGKSARFEPEHKLLKKFRGNAVIYHSVKSALNSKLDRVFIVLGRAKDVIVDALEELIFHPKLRQVYNADWESGRASSLRAGLHALPANTSAALIYPGDMPLLTPELIDDVVDAFVRTRQLCFPMYNREKGHPVAFPTSWFDALCRLENDESGYRLIQSGWHPATKLPRTDVDTQLNLNTLEDYERLVALEP